MSFLMLSSAMRLLTAVALIAALGACRQVASAQSTDPHCEAERWACDAEAVAADLVGHTSLLQTSVSLASQEQAPAAVGDAAGPSLKQKRFSASRWRRQRRNSHPSLLSSKANALIASTANPWDAVKGVSETNGHIILIVVLALIALTVSAACVVSFQDKPAGEALEADEKHPDLVEVRKPHGLDEDIYMLSIALITRDLHFMAKGTNLLKLRLFRMSYAAFLLFGTLGFQIMLLWATKVYVTPQAVANIRESYDAFEIHMYGGEENTRKLYTGKHRGLPGFFNESKFDTLDDDIKGNVCSIPFSQLNFIVLLLLIWSITCVAQLQRCTRYVYDLVIGLDTVSSMSDAMQSPKEGQPRSKRTIVGLTASVKVSYVLFIFLPWFASTCYLCWLGCRWLSATNSYGDLVANGMALEFILQFKELFYYAVASDRSKRDVRSTRIKPPAKKEAATCFAYFNTLIWGTISVFWVYLYIFKLQRVLPEYQWDVHGVCTPFLQGMLAPGGNSN